MTPRIGRSLGRAVILIGPDDWRSISVTSPINYRSRKSLEGRGARRVASRRIASHRVASRRGKKHACIEFKIQLHPCKNVSDYALPLCLSPLSSFIPLLCSLLFAFFRSRYSDSLLQNHNLGDYGSEQAAVSAPAILIESKHGDLHAIYLVSCCNCSSSYFTF